jgi:hypothetical protein
MATRILTSLTAFELSEVELTEAANLSTPTLCWLQNMLVQANEARLALNYDNDERYKFLQEEAYLKGQADVLALLLTAAPAFSTLKEI